MPVRLTPKQRRAAEALAQGYTQAEAAKVAGLTSGRVSQCMKEANFVQYVRALGGEQVEVARRKLRNQAPLAIQALVEVAGDRKAPHSARVSAASALLARTMPSSDAEELSRGNGIDEAELRRRIGALFGAQPRQAAPQGAEEPEDAPAVEDEVEAVSVAPGGIRVRVAT